MPTARTGIRLEVATVTPTEARAMLANRRPGSERNPKVVALLAGALETGRWFLNGMPIIRAPDGMVLDGVQRLYACVEADRPMVTVVASGVASDTLHTVDRHRRRTFAQVLAARGGEAAPHATSLVAALTRVLRIDATGTPEGKGSWPWSTLDRYLASNPWMPAAVEASIRDPGKAVPEAARSPLYIMLYAIGGGDPAKIPEHLRFVRGIGEPTDEDLDEGQPWAKLHDRLREFEGDPDLRPSITTVMALSTLAINAGLAGQKVRYLRWVGAHTSARRGEAFPLLCGYTGLRDAGVAGAAMALAADPDSNLTPSAEPSALRLSVETIDPARAAAYLEHNAKNRPIRPVHVNALARDIEAGAWMLNAQPICLDTQGRLLNGQHRLSAVIASGQSIEAVVARGVDDGSFQTYDTGRRRSAVQSTELAGFGDAPLLAATATLIWRHHAGNGSEQPTAAEIQQIINDNPGLMQERRYGRQMIEFLRPSVAMYLAWLIKRRNKKLGEVFLTRLRDAADLPHRHLILRLRKKLLGIRRTASQAQMLDTVLEAWEEFRVSPDLPELEADRQTMAPVKKTRAPRSARKAASGARSVQ